MKRCLKAIIDLRLFNSFVDTSDQGDETSMAQSIEDKQPESSETSSVVRDKAKISTISDKSLEITQQLLNKNGTERRKGSSFCSLL